MAVYDDECDDTACLRDSGLCDGGCRYEKLVHERGGDWHSCRMKADVAMCGT